MFAKKERKSGLLDFAAKSLLLWIICTFVSKVQIVSTLAVNNAIVIEVDNLTSDKVESTANDTSEEVDVTLTLPETSSNSIR